MIQMNQKANISVSTDLRSQGLRNKLGNFQEHTLILARD